MVRGDGRGRDVRVSVGRIADCCAHHAMCLSACVLRLIVFLCFQHDCVTCVHSRMRFVVGCVAFVLMWQSQAHLNHCTP
jgi:hypothetical protein